MTHFIYLIIYMKLFSCNLVSSKIENCIKHLDCIKVTSVDASLIKTHY